MAKYRACVIGSDGQFENSREFACDTDENAIVWAKQMAGLQPAELWSGKRLVERLYPSHENKRKECQLASSARGGSAMAKLDERTIEYGFRSRRNLPRISSRRRPRTPPFHCPQVEAYCEQGKRDAWRIEDGRAYRAQRINKAKVGIALTGG